MSNQQRQLWVDGYIAHTFGPQAAEWYHAYLLRRESRHINWNAATLGPLLAFCAAPPYGSGQAWTIDYLARDTGLVPVIPQQIWTPQTWPHHAAELHRPIFFVHWNCGDIGLPLIKAAAGDCMSLYGAEKTAPIGPSLSVRIHIGVSEIRQLCLGGHDGQFSNLQWHGYAPWNCPIEGGLETPWGILSHRFKTFAKHVAKTVMRFMEVT
jgi:hypothetical protein